MFPFSFHLFFIASNHFYSLPSTFCSTFPGDLATVSISLLSLFQSLSIDISYVCVCVYSICLFSCVCHPMPILYIHTSSCQTLCVCVCTAACLLSELKVCVPNMRMSAIGVMHLVYRNSIDHGLGLAWLMANRVRSNLSDITLHVTPIDFH